MNQEVNQSRGYTPGPKVLVRISSTFLKGHCDISSNIEKSLGPLIGTR